MSCPHLSDDYLLCVHFVGVARTMRSAPLPATDVFAVAAADIVGESCPRHACLHANLLRDGPRC
jgi:hypothetical protein